MKSYTFDFTLRAAYSFHAASQEEAEQRMAGIMKLIDGSTALVNGYYFEVSAVGKPSLGDVLDWG